MGNLCPTFGSSNKERLQESHSDDETKEEVKDEQSEVKPTVTEGGVEPSSKEESKKDETEKAAAEETQS